MSSQLVLRPSQSHIAVIEANSYATFRNGQFGLLRRAAIDEAGPLLAEFGLCTLGHAQHARAAWWRWRRMRLEEYRRAVRRLTVEEKLRFLDQAYARDGHTGLMLQTLLETSARASELVQLRVE
jgi:integrase